MDLGIPKGSEDLPDIINEALWGIDFFKRMQMPDGAIRGGIESESHPKYGEASWQESWPVMAYAPDPWSSYLYAEPPRGPLRALVNAAPSSLGAAAGYAKSARAR